MVATTLNAKYESLNIETSEVSFGHDAVNGASMDCKVIIQPYHDRMHSYVFSVYFTCSPMQSLWNA